jgi:lipoprotein-releasing system permease protein
MNLPFRIASRYLVSKKSTNAINIISGISILGMMVGAMGLVLVLSVFNGFEDLVKSLYNTFNPELQITARQGITFPVDSSKIILLKKVNGIKAVAEVLEANALLRYENNQDIPTIKGVSDNYNHVSNIDSAILRGKYLLHDNQNNYAILGAGVEQKLGINVTDPAAIITVYVPRKGFAVTSIDPSSEFNEKHLYYAGTFAIQQDFDSKYVLVPLGFAQDLTGYANSITALELSILPNASIDDVQQQVTKIMGGNFVVKNRLQQSETLYKIMKTEKWAVYAILTLILVVAAFNILGSLSMLVIEKKKDISILKAMGADGNLIQNIFLLEGTLMSLAGCSVGFILAIIICILQQHFGLIKLQGDSFVVSAYPVSMKFTDFILVFFTVLVIGFLAAWFPAKRASLQLEEIRFDQ